MSNISEKLDENIERYLDEIAGLKTDDDRTSRVINEAVKLHELRMNEQKLLNESAKQVLETQKETNAELTHDEEVKERKKDRWFKVGVAAAEIVLPLTVYGVLAYIGYAREFDGVVTSDTLKRVLNSIKPKR